MKRERAREPACCSWRIRPVFQRQARFCPKVVIRSDKYFINSLLTCTNAHIDTDMSSILTLKYLRQIAQENNNKRLKPTSVVWHSFAQSLSSPSQTSHTSPPAPSQTVCASQ